MNSSDNFSSYLHTNIVTEMFLGVKGNCRALIIKLPEVMAALTEMNK